MTLILSILFDRPIQNMADKFDITTITFHRTNQHHITQPADVIQVVTDINQPCTLHFHVNTEIPQDVLGISHITITEGDDTTNPNTLPKPVTIQDIRIKTNTRTEPVTWDFANYVFHPETAISHFKTVSTRIRIEFDFDADISDFDPKCIDLLGLAREAAIRELISELESDDENDYNQVDILGLSTESCIGE